MRTIAVTKITRKDQTTVPREIREELDLKVGDKVVWFINDKGEIVVKKA